MLISLATSRTPNASTWTIAKHSQASVTGRVGASGKIGDSCRTLSTPMSSGSTSKATGAVGNSPVQCQAEIGRRSALSSGFFRETIEATALDGMVSVRVGAARTATHKLMSHKVPASAQRKDDLRVHRLIDSFLATDAVCNAEDCYRRSARAAMASASDRSISRAHWSVFETAVSRRHWQARIELSFALRSSCRQSELRLYDRFRERNARN